MSRSNLTPVEFLSVLDTGCIASGAQKIYDEMARLCEDIDGVTVEMQKDVPHVGVIKNRMPGLMRTWTFNEN